MIETKAKNDLINDLINDLKNKDDIILWIENLIASNLSPSDKIDILKYEKSYLQNVDKSGLSDNYKFFLDLISEENYVDAVRFSDYLSYIILPQKRDEIKETIKNRKFYFLTPKLEIEMGGMGRTILYRANFLANEGYDITLVNIGPVKNYPFITIHDCILNKNDENLEIIYFQQKEHMCKCSFFKILLSVWTDKIQCENLLYLFLQNYKIKIELGLNYIAIYNILIHNNAKNLFSFACQVFTSDFMINVIKNPIFIVIITFNIYKTVINIYFCLFHFFIFMIF